MNRYPEADIVTALDIATRLGVQHRTVYKWRQRGMPEPDFMLRPPLWRWVTIEAWAKATGRLE